MRIAVATVLVLVIAGVSSLLAVGSVGNRRRLVGGAYAASGSLMCLGVVYLLKSGS